MFSSWRWQLPILPGAWPSTLGVRELNFCVRDGNRWILSAIVTTMVYKVLSHVISWYPWGFSARTHLFSLHIRKLTTTYQISYAWLAFLLWNHSLFVIQDSYFFVFLNYCWDQALDLLVSVSYTSYNASTSDLSTLSSIRGLTLSMGYLILRSVSHLDAFSVYLLRTSLPCRATGVTTGAQ